LKKGYTVTDWSKRPIDSRQIKYALNDVIYLYDLWQNLVKKATEKGRASWIVEECQTIEKAAYYHQSPYKELYNSNIVRTLRQKQQIFLHRLYQWRTNLAREKNYSRDMILSNKLIGSIVRAVSGGKEALLANRRLPERTMHRYADIFAEMFKQEATPEELEILKQIPMEKNEDPKQDIINEMLHMLIKYKCLEENLSINLVMPRQMLKRLKADSNYFEPSLETGWRTEFLSEELISWLKFRNDLKLVFGGGKFELTFGD